MDNNLRVIIKTEIDNEVKDFELDYIESYSISSSVGTTSVSFMDGTKMIDGTYPNPTTINISGTFSLNRSYHEYDYNGVEGRLKNIQLTYEKLLEESIPCVIVKEGKNQLLDSFVEHKNMILTSVRWVEQGNSLDFGFTFTERLLYQVELDNSSSKYIDKDNTELSYYVGENSKFEEEFFNAPDILGYFWTSLIEQGYTDTKFIEYYIKRVQSNTIDTKDLSPEYMTAAGLATLGVGISIFSRALGFITFSMAGALVGLGWLKNKILKSESFFISSDELTNEKRAKKFHEITLVVYEFIESIKKNVRVYSADKVTSSIYFSINDNDFQFKLIKGSGVDTYSLEMNGYEVVNNVDEYAITSFNEANSSNYLIEVGNEKIYLVKNPYYDGNGVERIGILITDRILSEEVSKFEEEIIEKLEKAGNTKK